MAVFVHVYTLFKVPNTLYNSLPYLRAFKVTH